eukprot:m.184353 g.184353  ORF g.184353 m.184353 type:complete len:382 (+) comp16905_c0_seq3:166-1311(+)
MEDDHLDDDPELAQVMLHTPMPEPRDRVPSHIATRTPTNDNRHDSPFLPSETSSSYRAGVVTPAAPLFNNLSLASAFEQLHQDLARGPARTATPHNIDLDDPVEAWQPTAYLDSSSSSEWLQAAPREALTLRIRALEQAVQYVLASFKQTVQLSDSPSESVSSLPSSHASHSRSPSRASTISAIANSRAPSRRAATATTRSLKSQHTDIPSEFLCPITYDIMVDPVVAADGFSYERESIRTWFLDHATSPLTGSAVPTPWIFPNQALRILIRDFCEKHGVPLPELAAPSQAEHQAPINLQALTRPGERSNYIPSDSTTRTHRQAAASGDGVTFLEAATGRDLTSPQAINSVAHQGGHGHQAAMLPSSLAPEARPSAACIMM